MQQKSSLAAALWSVAARMPKPIASPCCASVAAQVAALAIVFLLNSGGAEARDWFVRAGAAAGDGSWEKPFADPWQALDKAEAGDKVHVAEGEYYGKLEAGYWVIPFARVEMIGGYDAEFKDRDPWKHPSKLLWKKGSQNHTDTSVARVSGSRNDHSGAVLDGFFIDMKDLNTYATGEGGSLKEPRLQRAVSFEHPGAVIRNCVIANSPLTAVSIRQGVTLDNNVIVNSVDVAVDATGGNTLRGSSNIDPPVIRNNTIIGTWVSGSPAGKGGAGGIGIKIDKGTVIEGNIIALSANHGIWLGNAPVAAVTFRKNVFHRNLFSNVKFFFDGKDTSVDDYDMEALSDLGFGILEENTVADPGFSYDSAWLDGFTLHAFNHGKVFKAEDWNGLRETVGLPALTESGPAFAPVYNMQQVLSLLLPNDAKVAAGARVRKIDVKPFSAAASAPIAKNYRKTDLATWAKNPGAVDGQALEMLISLQGVANVAGLSDVAPETHGAKFIEGRVGGGDRIIAIYKKGTKAERVFDEAKFFGSFVGEASELYVARGTARVASGYPKARFIVDSIERYEATAAKVVRPAGRNWYVRASETGGDGSMAKPFRDPYQALEKAGSGDIIHVTEGEYGGKLKNGRWIVGKPWIALLGSYDREFQTRDPWEHPSVLEWPANSKTTGQGYLLEGDGDHTGLIIDGFIFDHRTLNRYLADGSLDPSSSDKSEHVSISSLGVIIRNCVFVNGASGALRMSVGQIVENNLFVNQSRGGYLNSRWWHGADTSRHHPQQQLPYGLGTPVWRPHEIHGQRALPVDRPKS